MSDISDTELKRALMKVDFLLKQRQSFWETPRNLALIITAVAAIAGFVGFKLGNQPIRIEVSQPFAIKLTPSQ